MTKVEKRKEALTKHYAALEKLAILCGLSDPDGKKLSLKLWKLEQIASKAAIDYCNGVIQYNEFETITGPIKTQVNALFNNNLKGLFINGDPRGYTLKIRDDIFSKEYRETTRLTQDAGGYGILSPDLSIQSFRN